MMMVFEEVMRVKCAYATHVGRSDCEKDQFYNEMASEWDLQNPDKMILGSGDYSRHVARRMDGFEGVHGGYGIGVRTIEGRRLLEFYGKKWLCVAVANTWFHKKAEENNVQNL